MSGPPIAASARSSRAATRSSRTLPANTRAGDTHVNSAESYFALLKRGVIGSFHHISKEHLDRYCDEFSFRWDHRKTTDSERTIEAIKGAEGKRLSYRDPIGSS